MALIRHVIILVAVSLIFSESLTAGSTTYDQKPISLWRLCGEWAADLLARARAKKQGPFPGVEYIQPRASGYHVDVVFDNAEYSVLFARSDRTLDELRQLHGAYLPTDWISPQAFQGKRVLDVGTGKGSFVEQLRAEGVDVIGVDIVLLEKQKTKPYFVQASATALPKSLGKFQRVTSHFSVFFHDNGGSNVWQESLDQIARVLEPGGDLILYPALPGVYRLLSLDPRFTVVHSKYQVYRGQVYYTLRAIRR